MIQTAVLLPFLNRYSKSFHATFIHNDIIHPLSSVPHREFFQFADEGDLNNTHNYTQKMNNHCTVVVKEEIQNCFDVSINVEDRSK